MKHPFLCLSVFIILAFMASPLFAADFCGTFGEYDDQIKRRLGIDTTDSGGLTDTTSHSFVREAVILVMNALGAEKVEFTDTLIYKRRSYALDSTLLNIMSVVIRDGDSIKYLIPKPQSEWWTLRGTEGLIGPTYYDWSSTQLFIYPLPKKTGFGAGDSLLIYATRKVPSIAAVDSLAIIPQEYRVAILHYAVYMVAVANSDVRIPVFEREYKQTFALLQLSLNIRGQNEAGP